MFIGRVSKPKDSKRHVLDVVFIRLVKEVKKILRVVGRFSFAIGCNAKDSDNAVLCTHLSQHVGHLNVLDVDDKRLETITPSFARKAAGIVLSCACLRTKEDNKVKRAA